MAFFIPPGRNATLAAAYKLLRAGEKAPKPEPAAEPAKPARKPAKKGKKA